MYDIFREIRICKYIYGQAERAHHSLHSQDLNTYMLCIKSIMYVSHIKVNIAKVKGALHSQATNTYILYIKSIRYIYYTNMDIGLEKEPITTFTHQVHTHI